MKLRRAALWDGLVVGTAVHHRREPLVERGGEAHLAPALVGGDVRLG